MPGMNGLDVQRRLAVLGIALPLVFITAHEEEGIAQRAIAMGAIGFLQKPFNDESLDRADPPGAPAGRHGRNGTKVQ